MPKVYHPLISEDVEASPPHDSGTAYKVSRGIEYWRDKPVQVLKVQMAYDGVVSGRRSPSYPTGTDDLERVIDALRRIRDGEGDRSRGMILPQ